MALIECSECHKQVSDKAAACPHCGAPVSTVLPLHQKPATLAVPVRKAKTSPITWIALILAVVGALWLFQNAERQSKLSPLPVEVKTRPAITGPGLVLYIKNTSSNHLTLLVTLRNPTTREAKNFTFTTAPSDSLEIGHSEGWPLASGDEIAIENHSYKTWQSTLDEKNTSERK